MAPERRLAEPSALAQTSRTGSNERKPDRVSGPHMNRNPHGLGQEFVDVAEPRGCPARPPAAAGKRCRRTSPQHHPDLAGTRGSEGERASGMGVPALNENGRPPAAMGEREDFPESQVQGIEKGAQGSTVDSAVRQLVDDPVGKNAVRSGQGQEGDMDRRARIAECRAASNLLVRE
ncbi:MAG TPA: hypothetical protein VMN83_06630 [Albitalea sp.]|nr:hypothetical protein [Albitalea sp.]HUG22184.1 hypothetical protein [Albitalea sp.]